MARVDYEAAWTELLAYAANKTSHGRTDLMVKMAQLAEEHRIPEDLLEKAARILGGPIQVMHTAEERPAAEGDQRIAGRMDERPPPTDDRGGHDGRETEDRHGDPVRS